MTNISVIIPFRDRGVDLRRGANLEVVMAWWWAHGFSPVIMDDGLTGDAQFNRHRAYNKGVARFPETDVFIFSEADMLIPVQQIIDAVRLAEKAPGLVVPFKQYRYMSDSITGYIRDLFSDRLDEEQLAEWVALSAKDPASIFEMRAESIMKDGKSIGAVNVVSRQTLAMTGGFTEATSGNWYDDNIIEEGFRFLAGPTRWVDGPALHLYHLPGWKGDHLTEADKLATKYNRGLLRTMRGNILKKDAEAVRRLLAYRREN